MKLAYCTVGLERDKKVSNFDYLLIAHLVGDFLFQTKWMADNKSNLWLPLIVHSSIYTAIIWLVSYLAFGGLSVTGCVLIFGGHLILDKRKIINFWSTKIMKIDENSTTWIKIVIDQSFHLILLAIALHI